MTEIIETSRSSAPLSVTSACRTLDIARSTFYSYRSYDPFVDTDVELRDRVQKTALEWPSYGYRRITHELLRRGSQYASSEYIKTLVDNGIAISMSRKGVPQDNAYAESFMKTLKYEEVYMTEYANIADARRQIAHFVDEVYNKKRLHSAIGYLPPTEFESVGYNKEKVTH